MQMIQDPGYLLNIDTLQIAAVRGSVKKIFRCVPPLFCYHLSTGYNTRLTTFAQLPETISKVLLWNRSQNSCHTIFDGIHVRRTCTFDGRLLVPAFVALCRSFLGSERDSSSVVSLPSRKRKYSFCSRLPSRTPAPTFHSSFAVFPN